MNCSPTQPGEWHEFYYIHETPKPMSTTIFALATPPGRGAVAIIRLSGPNAGAALSALTGREKPLPRRLTRANLRYPGTGDLIDQAMVVWFPGPDSYTGEDVVEFQVHGGRAVVAAVCEALLILPGIGPAEPGAFTRRAFDNGKLDLTQAEAIADLIDADTLAQRHQALRQLGGEIGAKYEEWRSRLIHTLACLEAVIDFPDEDLPAALDQAATVEITALIADMDAHLADGRRGELLREGLAVAIIGPPNAGKSSLLNALARRDAAIVSARSGTTRDVIEVHLDLGGYPLILADTAGLRDTADEIEGEGVRRALARATDSDIKIAVFDGAVWPAVDSMTVRLLDNDTLIVVNKADIHGQDAPMIGDRPALALCARNNDGVPILVQHLTAMARERLEARTQPTLTRIRHRVAVAACRDALMRALTPALTPALPELVAEDVRLATRALAVLTGRITTDDVLAQIFREFCIGK